MNPIRLAYLEQKGQPLTESKILATYFESQNIPVQFFPAKKLQRRRLKLSPETLVAGQVTTVLSALKQLGVEAPQLPSYPNALLKYLRRKVTYRSLKQIESLIHTGCWETQFVKPSRDSKRFTGFILSAPGDLGNALASSKHLLLACSELVCFESEWRYFILRGNVLGRKQYLGSVTLPCRRSSLETPSLILKRLETLQRPIPWILAS
ncbi:MAG: ATP-grasp domain-containing protein [Planctomycetota bacterium]|nr:ATP-grasp domain-containing protein [Planctomycetota bacterium]